MIRFAPTKSLLVLTYLVALMLLLPVIASAQWSQYQGNAAHTGYVPETVGSGGFVESWQAAFTYSGSPALVSGLAVNSGGVFAVSYIGRTVNGSDVYSYYNLTSLNPETGVQQWSTQVSSYGGTVSAPSLGGGMVYVHSYGNSGLSGGNPPSEYPYLMGTSCGTGTIQFTTRHLGQWGSGSRPTGTG